MQDFRQDLCYAMQDFRQDFVRIVQDFRQDFVSSLFITHELISRKI